MIAGKEEDYVSLETAGILHIHVIIVLPLTNACVMGVQNVAFLARHGVNLFNYLGDTVNHRRTCNINL